MATPLFRREAIDAKQMDAFGTIVLPRPPSLKMLAAFSLVVAAAAALFLCFGEYTRRTRVVGTLVPDKGVAEISAPAAGHLRELRVAEGAYVAAGDIVAVIALPGATRRNANDVSDVMDRVVRRRDTLDQASSSRRAQLELQRRSLADQRDSRRTERLRIDDELATRRRMHALEQESVGKFRALLRSGYVSDAQLKRQEAAVLEQEIAIRALERQAASLDVELRRLAQAIDDVPLQLAMIEAERGRDRALLEQEGAELESRREVVVKAAVSGTVAALQVKAGQAVSAGQTLGSLLPERSRMEAHLSLPDRAVGFISPGDRVLLRYDAFPYQKFGQQEGEVLRVSASTVDERADGDDARVYRAVVRLRSQTIHARGRDVALRPGLSLSADVMGERRTLWEWVMEPVYSMTERGPR